MSNSFDYDKAMEQINTLLEELQDPQIKMKALEDKVVKARQLIEACEAELKKIEEKLTDNSGQD